MTYICPSLRGSAYFNSIHAEWIFIKLYTEFIRLKVPLNSKVLTSYTRLYRRDIRTHFWGGSDVRRFTKCSNISGCHYCNSRKSILFIYITGTVETIETTLVVKVWTKSIAVMGCRALELHVLSTSNWASQGSGIASRKFCVQCSKD